MRIWAIANQKGGVGKTTTTLALGRGLAALGHRVLLIDLDPHSSLTRAFGVAIDPPPRGVLDLFGTPPSDLASLAHESSIPGLSYVCAQAALATLERRSANQPGLGLALQNAMTRHAGQHDYILLDCPPTLGLLMINALAACDRVVVPTQAEPLALHGLASMVRTADMVQRRHRNAEGNAGHLRPGRLGRRGAGGHPNLQRRRPDRARRWRRLSGPRPVRVSPRAGMGAGR